MLPFWPGWKSGCSRGRRWRSPWDRPLLRGGCSLGNVKKMGHWHMFQQYLIESYQHATGFERTGLQGGLAGWRGSWVDLYSPLQWPLLWDAECLGMWLLNGAVLRSSPSLCLPDGCWAMGLCFLDRVSTVGLCFPDGTGAESLCFLDELIGFGLILAKSHTKFGN